jgi:hypothetical protein
MSGLRLCADILVTLATCCRRVVSCPAAHAESAVFIGGGRRQHPKEHNTQLAMSGKGRGGGKKGIIKAAVADAALPVPPTTPSAERDELQKAT